MVDFSLKQGNTSPGIRSQLQDDDESAVDITGFNEVTFRMRAADGTVIVESNESTGAVTVVNAVDGIVTYEWQPGDTDIPAMYEAEWIVEFSDGSEETFPNNDWIYVKIFESIA